MPLKVVPRRDRKLHRLIKKGETLELKRGESLYSPGDRGHELFLVKTGQIHLTADHETPGEKVSGIIGPWEMTGEEALLPGTVRRAGARAGEDSLIIPLEGSAVNRAFRTASKTYGAFIAAKEEELALARALSGPRRAGGAARQLGALLLHLSARLGRGDEKKGVKIPIRLPHRVLADLAGCHRSTVTTILNDWIYDGVLTQTEGRIRILDPECLAG
jgi:CRP-like cAMP-binding protein